MWLLGCLLYWHFWHFSFPSLSVLHTYCEYDDASNACVVVLCVDMGSMAKTQVDQKAGKLLRIIIIMNECFYHH